MTKKEQEERVFSEGARLYQIAGDGNASVCILANHPGAANCLAPVGRIFFERGTRVVFLSTGVAGEIFDQKFPEKQPLDTLPNSIKFVLVSADTPVDFEIESFEKIKTVNPEARCVVIEDFPGSVEPMIDAFQQKGELPCLVLTTTRDQARKYQQKYGLGRSLIIPIGQPGFDPLLKEDTSRLSLEAREALEIPSQAIVVTYIGQPVADLPLPGGGDLNTKTLEAVVLSMKEMSKMHKDKQLFFIYKPHPREAIDSWVPRVLTTGDNPNNLQTISMGKEQWLRIGLTTRQICAASDLVVTMFSTVGQEVALANTKSRGGEPRTIPLHVLLLGAPGEYLKPGGLLVVDLGASAVAKSPSEVSLVIEKSLFDENYRKKIIDAEKTKFKDEYRFKSSAAQRAYEWIRLIGKYGDDAADFISRFSSLEINE